MRFAVVTASTALPGISPSKQKISLRPEAGICGARRAS